MEELAIQAFGVSDTQITEQISSFSTWEDFINSALIIVAQKNKCAWYLGLLALGVETKFGEKTIDKFSKEIGVSSSTIKVYRWVVGEYLKNDPKFIPPERLSFGVLQSIAHLPVEERQKFLEEAQDGDMSVERVRVEIQKQQGKPVKPKYAVEFCAEHNLWTWVPGKPEEWELPHE